MAACDLDKNHLKSAPDTMNGHYQNQDCKTYHDYREMMARKDIDAVMLAVPDHWHALVAVEAADNGKDIYGEKPLARTIAEQQAMVKAVQKNKRIWQTGSWQRSERHFHYAREIVRNGLIGKLKRVEVGLPDWPQRFCEARKRQNRRSRHRRPELDYETWIGPSRMEPYIQARSPQELALELQHRRRPVARLDRPSLRHRALGHGLRQHPARPRSKAHGEFPPQGRGLEHLHEIPHHLEISERHRDDHRRRTQRHQGRHEMDRHGRLGLGESRQRVRDLPIPKWNDSRTLPEELRKVKLYESSDHMRQFPRLREVAQADHHARRNRASLRHPRPPRPHLHARRARRSSGT